MWRHFLLASSPILFCLFACVFVVIRLRVANTKSSHLSIDLNFGSKCRQQICKSVADITRGERGGAPSNDEKKSVNVVHAWENNDTDEQLRQVECWRAFYSFPHRLDRLRLMNDDEREGILIRRFDWILSHCDDPKSRQMICSCLLHFFQSFVWFFAYSFEMLILERYLVAFIVTFHGAMSFHSTIRTVVHRTIVRKINYRRTMQTTTIRIDDDDDVREPRLLLAEELFPLFARIIESFSSFFFFQEPRRHIWLCEICAKQNTTDNNSGVTMIMRPRKWWCGNAMMPSTTRTIKNDIEWVRNNERNGTTSKWMTSFCVNDFLVFCFFS